MADAWVGAAATLLGVALGQGLAFIQRRWQVADRREAAEEKRRDEVRARMDVKADEILHLLRELDDLLLKRIVLGYSSLMPGDTDDRKRVRAVIRDIDVASGYLTRPLRRYVRTVVDLIPDAEQLSQDRWVEASARSIAWSCMHFARRCLERHMRGEALPADLGEPVGTYMEGWQELQNWEAHQLEAQLGNEGEAAT